MSSQNHTIAECVEKRLCTVSHMPPHIPAVVYHDTSTTNEMFARSPGF